MPQEETRRERVIHKVFVWGVIIKAFDGAVELLGGIALFFPGQLANLAATLIRNELVEDPHDFIATHLQHVLPAFLAQSGWFAAFYLLAHGVIKLVLVAGLLRDKVWAYPTAIVVFALFIVYQLARYMATHAFFLIALSVLDAAVIVLTWHEYQYYRTHRVFAQ